MIIEAIFFYLFAAATVGSGAMVVAARNPVHAVFCLILSFFSASGLFILMGAEFIAMLLVVVYVGAVAVLLLFVVMMLDIDYRTLGTGLRRHLPLGLVVWLVLMAELALLFRGPETTAGVRPPAAGRTNIQTIGDILYTDNIYLFQLAGLILLVAMVAAITLTLRRREGVKRQRIADQNARSREETISLVHVESNTAPQSITGGDEPGRKVLR